MRRAQKDTQKKYLVLLFLAGSVLGATHILGWWGDIPWYSKLVTASITEPLQDITHKLNSVVEIVGQLQAIQLQNLQLRQELAESVGADVKISELEAENEFLRSQLALAPRPQSIFTVAKVLFYESSVNVGHLWVDAEAREDYLPKEGDWVAVYNYLVGKVVEVKDSRLRVRLIAASGTEESVLLGADSLGILYGDAGVSIQIREIPGSSRVQAGDKVKLLNPGASDLASYYLGQVKTVRGTPADPTLTAEVELLVDIYSLERVFIIPK